MQFCCHEGSHSPEMTKMSILFTQLCPTLCDPIDCGKPGFPVLHHLPELAQTRVHWTSDAIFLSLPPSILLLVTPFHPLSSPILLLLLLPSIFPRIRVLSNESALCIRWPKYWSFSFSISPPSEYSRLISFRMNRFDLLAVQATHKSLLQDHSSKASVLWHSAFYMVQLSHLKWLLEKP